MNSDTKLQILEEDPWLKPYEGRIKHRISLYLKRKKEIEEHENGLEQFASSYKKYGLRRVEGGVQFREWAPAAQSVALMGDFNGWNRESHKCNKNSFGLWELFLPNKPDGSSPIPHNSKIKIAMVTATGSHEDRLPAWSVRVEPESPKVPNFNSIFWDPPQPYVWKHKAPKRPASLKIYEAHVGMATVDPKIGSYKEFTKTVIPYVADLGYNAIQLMAIMEHSYYASFGYQVTNFFAISSRYGTPEELMELIDTAHSLGISVYLDVVHSHASRNVSDGLNQFDGTDHCYFHDGGKGYHSLWDSRLFNYFAWEVQRFLLSSLRWYLDEYKFDGFRFDGVTSMIYLHHGIAYGFSSYDDYNNDLVDDEALVYLMLANDLIHSLKPDAVTIAEEVSGFPGLCRKITEGGAGFDYRLGMAIPDKWIQLLKEQKDEEWNMGNLCHTLTNRRWKEATIAYAESHDQALVGDKTIAFWLMDKEMYDFMSVLSPPSAIIDRGLALHKMIRLITNGLGGEGYLNFMGNEFGHPEWIDFPRVGNNESYHYCRRRWDLAHDELLKYKFLLAFDKSMNKLENKYGWLHDQPAYVSAKHEENKVIVFDRAGLVFAFNFHPTQSFPNYMIGVPTAGKYKVILDSDDKQFGGHGRIDHNAEYFSSPHPYNGRPNSLQVYLPCRAGLVFANVSN